MKNLRKLIYTLLIIFASAFSFLKGQTLTRTFAMDLNLYDLYNLSNLTTGFGLYGEIPAGGSIDIMVFKTANKSFKVYNCTGTTNSTVLFANSHLLRTTFTAGSHRGSMGTATVLSNTIYDDITIGYNGSLPSGKDCGRRASSNSLTYIRDHALLANVLINNSRGSTTLTRFTIEIKFTNVPLNRFYAFYFMGNYVDTKLVIPTAFNSQHPCFSTPNATGVCSELTSIRTPNFNNAEDLRISAHRGVWGLPTGPQENTIAAMTAAKNLGIKIMESDLMPTNVTDGGNYVNSLSGQPQDLVCFHDFILTRVTNETNAANRVYNRTLTQLKSLYLKRPRTNTTGTDRIMSLAELVTFCKTNNVVAALDIKNLEANGSTCTGSSSSDLCGWNTDARKKQSLNYNIKKAINSIADADLKYISIKTYESYEDLKAGVTTGTGAVTTSKFEKVLWIPMIAPSPKWQTSTSNATYSPQKVGDWVGTWFYNNDKVLYYEVNFFNDYDNQTAKFLEYSYPVYTNEDLNNLPLLGLIAIGGRRGGIFSEEPVGGRGTVNRWGKWSIKDPTFDRRGDALWLYKQAYMYNSVINTDRPDIWLQLKSIF